MSTFLSRVDSIETREGIIHPGQKRKQLCNVICLLVYTEVMEEIIFLAMSIFNQSVQERPTIHPTPSPFR